MRIRVDHHPDNHGAFMPWRIHLDGRQVEILETIDQWYGPDYRYLKVKGRDGGLYVLRFDESSDEWALIMYQRAQTNSPRPSAP
jgi:hypothetical protein